MLDDQAIEATSEEVSRRRVLGWTLLASLWTAAAGTFAVTLRFLWPRVLFEPPSLFAIARRGDLEGTPIFFDRERRVFVVRDPEGVFAQSAVCPHLGCLVRVSDRGDGFFCPCHGSEFALDGEVLKGPSPAPLARYRLELREDELWVDVARKERRDRRVEA